MGYVQDGHRVTISFPYGVTVGGGVKKGNIFGVAVNTQVTSDNAEIQTVGVVDLTKDASTFTDGAFVFWDDVAKKCTSLPATNMMIGAAVLVMPDGTSALGGLTGDATVRVRLNGAFNSNGGTLRFARFLYSFATDGGVSCTPAISDTIPANALVYGGVVNSTTAVTAAGSATVAVGTTAGSSTTSILAATAKASLSLDAVLAATATATPFKMSAAGQINVTIATGPLTAGVIEGLVLYTIATNA